MFLRTSPALGGATLICFTGNSIRTAGEGQLMSTQKTRSHRTHSRPQYSTSVVLRGASAPTPTPAHTRPHQEDSLEMPATFLVVTSQRTVLARKAKDTAEHPRRTGQPRTSGPAPHVSSTEAEKSCSAGALWSLSSSPHVLTQRTEGK